MLDVPKMATHGITKARLYIIYTVNDFFINPLSHLTTSIIKMDKKKGFYDRACVRDLIHP